MIPLGLATWIVRLSGLYLLIGLLFALPFAWRWAARLDPNAEQGTGGFQLLVIPGGILLWPLLLSRLVRSRP